MENTQENVGKREEQLRRWGCRLHQIVTKAENVGIEVDAVKRQRIDDVRAKFLTAQSKLDEYRTAGCQKWEVFKTGVETAWSDLEAAFKKLKD